MKMTRRQKRNLYRILAVLCLFLLAEIIPMPPAAKTVCRLFCYGVIGYDILWRAFTNILSGHIFDENFLMALATVGAIALGEYTEGVAVMLFYQVGELFQSCAVGRSRQSIAELMDIRPDYANVIRDGVEIRQDPQDVSVGETIVVRPGERIPLDGQVVSGDSLLDTSALTGESVPRQVSAGEEIMSGCINQTGVLTICVSRAYGESTVSRILELVENATDKKAKTENFITRFAAYYTPVVVIGAVVLAFLPPLILGGSFSTWIHRALNFLVVSCPCALVISVPLSFFGGIGAASKWGILVKGSSCLEVLSELETVVFDKTGTLTEGRFRVANVIAKTLPKEEVLRLAAYAEQGSVHPISRAIVESCQNAPTIAAPESIHEYAGHGVSVVCDGDVILAGNDKLMAEHHVDYEPVETAGTVVYVAKNQTYAGAIVVEDVIREDAKKAIPALRQMGIRQTVMLTGDTPAAAGVVGEVLGIDRICAKLLPAGKVEKIEEILENSTGKVAFVGDGINDAPVLARADVGIAMGGLGSDAAIEAADVVIMTDEPSKIVAAMKIARKTMRIVYQNITFSIAIKVIVLLLSVIGYASMWTAVFADVGVLVLAILNSIRTLKTDAVKR